MKFTTQSPEATSVTFAEAPLGVPLQMSSNNSGTSLDTPFMKIKFEGSHASTFSLLNLQTGVVVQGHLYTEARFTEYRESNLILIK